MANASINRLKILCLHGYKQYDMQFKNRTNSLRKALKNMVEFHYISAPHKIPFDVHLKQQKELEQKLNDDSNANNADFKEELDDNFTNIANNNDNNGINVKNLDYLPRAVGISFLSHFDSYSYHIILSDTSCFIINKKKKESMVAIKRGWIEICWNRRDNKIHCRYH